MKIILRSFSAFKRVGLRLRWGGGADASREQRRSPSSFGLQSLGHTARTSTRLNTWHPALASDEIVEGTNNTVGAVRLLTLKGGGTIKEKLLAYNAGGPHLQICNSRGGGAGKRLYIDVCREIVG